MTEEQERIFQFLAGVEVGQCVYVVRERMQYDECDKCKCNTQEITRRFITRIYVHTVSVRKGRAKRTNENGYRHVGIDVVLTGSGGRYSEKPSHRQFTLGFNAFLKRKDAEAAIQNWMKE